jgi:poly-beta-1,6-N-acetyl-D-glucosamine synthase
MISVIITSWKEPNTIGKCIKSIADNEYSAIGKSFEVIQVSPDEETLDAGKAAAKELRLTSKQFIQIQDPKKGKPYALKLAIKQSKGDILIFTDGDTYFSKYAVKYLVEPFVNEEVGGVSGRPISMDKRGRMMGYWGHLLSDAAHHRRINTISRKRYTYYISDKTFFPMSGYIMATRRIDFKIPKNVLSDDAYISYSIRNKGLEIAYAPNAKCFVKYPTSLTDYYKQKVRSIGGFLQLEQMGIFKKDKQSRSLLIELEYIFFVINYAEDFKEILWSLLLFPVRFWTWVRIYWDRVIIRKDFQKSWVRVESTK